MTRVGSADHHDAAQHIYHAERSEASPIDSPITLYY
jgi:hypothetical protein